MEEEELRRELRKRRLWRKRSGGAEMDNEEK